ncbi:ATP-dependent DNA ligase [Alphaentomopoxvirus acuprea]|uniref:ATP-dependent DNA ligase n=1 Tax=Alphaentomopoxvirus acuprea TaxID=62099 RepID=W6JPM4_9POXV|nr:ATP-dependent DNA ligase [Anomala cuprea entomopoxvirus]BAO49534.1 ATP-dependent DNA ligase [Anomala cuprea entomopoxvirus]
MDVPIINLDNLYIHNGNKSRSFKQLLNNLQAKYLKDQEKTIDYLNTYDNIAGKNIKKKNGSTKVKEGAKHELVGIYKDAPPIHCIVCKSVTKNIDPVQVYFSQNKTRLKCTCINCNNSKSSYIRFEKLPSYLQQKLPPNLQRKDA